MSIQVRELPPYHVAYMRYVGPYGAHGIPELWTRFDKWMEARGLRPEARVTLGVGYDDPRITAAEQCRYDACVVVPADFQADRRVNVMDLPGGPCAVATFTGTADEITGAWDQRLHCLAAGKRLAARRPPVRRGLSRQSDGRREGRRLPL